MRRSPSVLASFFVAVLTSGCAHTMEATAREDREVVAIADRDGRPVEIDSAPAPLPAEPAVHARLSHVVTLGQANNDAVYDDPNGPPPDAPQPVIINNYGSEGGYYGGYYPAYYGGGYGYYGSGYYGGRGNGSRSAAHPQGQQSGGEPGGRPAAPAQTPHVGGNYPAPASFGPRPAR